MPHPIDRFVNRAFLLDVRIRSRHIGFGLVIVVIADEIFDRVVGKERLHLAIELRGEDLVRRQDQRGALQFLDHLGHGECLARSGDAEQHLIALARRRLFDQFGDRRRLIARRLIIADDLEPSAAFRPFRAIGPMGDERLPRLRLGEAGANLDGHRRAIWGQAPPFPSAADTGMIWISHNEPQAHPTEGRCL